MRQSHQEIANAQLDHARRGRCQAASFKQRMGALQDETVRKVDEYERKLCTLQDEMSGTTRPRVAADEGHKKELD